MKKLTKGFTLIELLVVISIIGILASLALASYSGAQKQARDTQRRSDLGQYRNGLESFAASNNGLYPISAAKYNVTGFCGTGALSNYLSSCPSDPITPNLYYYVSDASGTKFILYANIETAGYWYVCSSGKVDKSDSEPTIVTCP